jgi:hypothetical protein
MDGQMKSTLFYTKNSSASKDHNSGPTDISHNNSNSTPRTVQKLIADLIQSEDKFFFINHSVTATEGRKEWKLIQVNLKNHATTTSMPPKWTLSGGFLYRTSSR